MKLSDPQYRVLVSEAEWVGYGGAAGSGKSHIVTLDMLRHCQGPHANPMFRGLIMRRTYPQLTKSGALLDHCREMYRPYGAIYNHTRNEFEFPCGAKIALGSCQFEKNLEDYQGAQLDALAIDEATQWPLKFVQYLWGRARSKSGVKPRMKLSMNPDNDSWLYRFLYWWLSPETGLPIPERSGVIRHFRYVEPEFHWYDEPQYQVSAETGEPECVTTSATFIGATLRDNTHLMQSDPAYRQRLEQMSEDDRDRFLNGCWLASSKTGAEWDRELFTNVYIPLEKFPVPKHANDIVRMFCVDPSKGRSVKKGDYSAIVCMAQTSELAYVDADLKRRSPSEIIEDLFLFCEQDHHRIRSGDLIGIESTQFQSIFRDLIMNYAANHLDYALSKYLMSGGLIIPVEDMLKKEMRIRRGLDKRLTQREFRFLENPGTTLLLQQIKHFDGIPGVGKHDDGPDALAMCTQLPRYEQEYWENLRKEK